jgi:hypothetical protein
MTRERRVRLGGSIGRRGSERDDGAGRRGERGGVLGGEEE